MGTRGVLPNDQDISRPLKELKSGTSFAQEMTIPRNAGSYKCLANAMALHLAVKTRGMGFIHNRGNVSLQKRPY